ncbi:hypothetical protein IQ64_25840 [Streptomyces stelliscabiei]|nr:hypothetical protein IQ61_02305 [Streptomyces scabiei]KND42044.1 hypothetical protein IQ64_25840 [Streptomyces stelliscabiei]UJV45027.1 hypothetical protein CVT30_38905 [Streptomyces sp. AMCC400023]
MLTSAACPGGPLVTSGQTRLSDTAVQGRELLLQVSEEAVATGQHPGDGPDRSACGAPEPPSMKAAASGTYAVISSLKARAASSRSSRSSMLMSTDRGVRSAGSASNGTVQVWRPEPTSTPSLSPGRTTSAAVFDETRAVTVSSWLPFIVAESRAMDTNYC